MLTDKVYRYRTISTGETTQLLPYGFFGEHLPISLATEDVMNLSGHLPNDGDFKPRRCIYLDDIDKYLILDIGGNYSAPEGPLPAPVVDDANYVEPKPTWTKSDATPVENPVLVDPNDYKAQRVYLYLVDGTTHEMVCSYLYSVELCPEYKLYDEVTDMCALYDSTSGLIKVTFLIINKPLRSAYLARYRLCCDELGMSNPTSIEDKPNVQIHLEDLDFFNTIVPPGEQDEIGLGWHTETASEPGMTYVYVQMEPQSITKKLKTYMCCGELSQKYCTLTVDEAGRYSILIQSRVTVWAGPFLNFPLDIQYVVVTDYDGMNQHFVLVGPVNNAIAFDETEEHQPYKYNLTSFDSRYLLCLEDRKTRFLNIKRKYVFAQAEPPGNSYVVSDKDWEGGVVAGVYYPKRNAKSYPATGGNIVYLGYPTAWEPTSNVEPTTKESIWTLVDICDVYGGITSTVDTTEKRGYSADIVFLVDTSTSMAETLAKARDNMENLATTLSAIGVTDWRIGVVAYSQTQRAIFDATSTPPTMWATSISGVRNMAEQLLNDVGNPSGTDYAWHFSAAKWASSYYAWRSADAKCIVLITDTTNESDPNDILSAVGDLNNKGINGYVISYDSSYYQTLWSETNGAFASISGSWGSTMGYEIGNRIADANGTSDSDSWWDRAAAAWQPTVFYLFTPATSWGNNSFITALHDNISYITNNHIIRCKINYFVIYDNYPSKGGKPQNGIFIPGLVPGETVTMNFIARNESKTGTMKKLSIGVVEAPNDVSITISGLPNELEPGGVALISVEARYNPSASNPGTRHIEVKYRVGYWMLHSKMYCTEQPTGIIIDPDDPDNPDPYDPYDPSDPGKNNELYWVPSTQSGEYTPGWRKQIGFDPLYTLAYVTKTELEDGDVCYQPTWKDYRVYSIPEDEAKHCLYKTLDPKPITSLDGLAPCDSGVTWLKIRGPLYWQTTRDYECRVNKKVWYMVNTSATKTYIAYPTFDSKTMPTLEGTGFMIITYPEGTVIGPGQSVPVEMYWVPIFNSAGEEITKVTKDYRIEDTQEGAIGTVWDLNPGLFNNLIYNIPESSLDAKLTHTYIENISGDGMDIPVKPDQPLNKMDVKLLKPYIYHTMTWLDVDSKLLGDGYRYLVPAGVWAGVSECCCGSDEGGEKELPVGAKPEDMYSYKEYLSPAQGMCKLPEYVDHKFKANPEMLFNASSEHPYQLAPFNQEYADPYMATLFVGNVIMKSITLGNVAATDFNKYFDDASDFVPCDVDGNELLGWELVDFWPVPGDFDASVKKLATENNYYFKRIVYVKNRNMEKAIPLNIEQEKTDLPGFSLIGVKVLSEHTTLSPGEVAELEATFQFHYTYQEAKHLNMIPKALFVPRFEKIVEE